MKILQLIAKDSGYTIDSLSVKLELSRSATYSLLTGDNPTLNNIKKLSDAFGMSPSELVELLCRDESMIGVPVQRNSGVCPHCGGIIQFKIVKGDS